MRVEVISAAAARVSVYFSYHLLKLLAEHRMVGTMANGLQRFGQHGLDLGRSKDRLRKSVFARNPVSLPEG
jgi:hypothetical protein